MSHDPRSWWRVEVDSAGAVVSCREVEAAEANSSGVFYVEARDEKEAGRRAWNAYCLVSQRRRRERLIAEGKCAWCAGIQDRGPRKRCTVCLRNERDRRARDRGEDPVESVPAVAAPVAPAVPVDEALSLADARAVRAAEDRRRLQLDLLEEVRKAWFAAQTCDQFSEWLRVRMVELGAPATGRAPEPAEPLPEPRAAARAS